jgi:hypothetical protein
VGQIAETDLRKASGNIERVQEFFASRISWKADAACGQELQRMDLECAGLVDTVGTMLQHNGLSFTKQRRPEEVPQRPPGNLEAARVEKFAQFMAQQHLWFNANVENRVAGAGRELLRSIHRCLCTTNLAVQMVLEHNQLQRLAPEKRHPSTAAAPRNASGASPEQPIKERTIKDPKLARLELIDTVENPLLVSFKGGFELSSDTKGAIDQFLARNDIEMSNHQLRRYLDKVVHWIEAIPEGQALVLKISLVQDEPYPSYAPRSDR